MRYIFPQLCLLFISPVMEQEKRSTFYIIVEISQVFYLLSLKFSGLRTNLTLFMVFKYSSYRIVQRLKFYFSLNRVMVLSFNNHRKIVEYLPEKY